MRIIWKKGNINKWNQDHPRSNPVQYKKQIIFGTNESTILCLETKTGKTIWKYKIQNKIISGRGFKKKGILSTPAIHKDLVYVGGNDGFLYCFEPGTGKKVWERFVTEWISSTPCIYEGTLFIGIEYGTDGGSLAAYSVQNGTLKWELRADLHVESSPKIDPYRQIVVCGSNDGCVYAAQAESGKLLWKYESGSEIKSGFAIDAYTGQVYFGSMNGVLYCLDINTGATKWHIKIGSQIFATPEIVGEKVIICTVSNGVFAFRRDGKMVWRFPISNKIYGSTFTYNEKVYFGCDGGFLYVLDQETGDLIVKADVGFPILTKPLVTSQQVIIGGKGQYAAVQNKPI